MKALQNFRNNQTDFDLLFRSRSIWQELADDYRFLVRITDKPSKPSVDKNRIVAKNGQPETEV